VKLQDFKGKINTHPDGSQKSENTYTGAPAIPATDFLTTRRSQKTAETSFKMLREKTVNSELHFQESVIQEQGQKRVLERNKQSPTASKEPVEDLLPEGKFPGRRPAWDVTMVHE
jgi:hypothetical protein